MFELSMFELMEVVIKTVADHQNGRKSQKVPFCIFFKLKREHGPFLQGIKQEIDRMPFKKNFDFVL